LKAEYINIAVVEGPFESRVLNTLQFLLGPLQKQV